MSRWPYQPKCESSITVKFNEDPPRFGLGYWSIRGLGAPIRMMLCAAKVNHVNYLHDCVEEGESGWSNLSWVETKKEIREHYNPLANLPYLVDEQERFVLAQSNACLEYLGDLLHMMGRNALERALCAQFLCGI